MKNAETGTRTIGADLTTRRQDHQAFAFALGLFFQRCEFAVELFNFCLGFRFLAENLPKLFDIGFGAGNEFLGRNGKIDCRGNFREFTIFCSRATAYDDEVGFRCIDGFVIWLKSVPTLV